MKRKIKILIVSLILMVLSSANILANDMPYESVSIDSLYSQYGNYPDFSTYFYELDDTQVNGSYFDTAYIQSVLMSMGFGDETYIFNANVGSTYKYMFVTESVTGAVLTRKVVFCSSVTQPFYLDLNNADFEASQGIRLWNYWYAGTTEDAGVSSTSFVDYYSSGSKIWGFGMTTTMFNVYDVSALPISEGQFTYSQDIGWDFVDFHFNNLQDVTQVTLTMQEIQSEAVINETILGYFDVSEFSTFDWTFDFTHSAFDDYFVKTNMPEMFRLTDFDFVVDYTYSDDTVSMDNYTNDSTTQVPYYQESEAINPTFTLRYDHDTEKLYIKTNLTGTYHIYLRESQFNSILQYISKYDRYNEDLSMTKDVEYLIYTGDMPQHNAEWFDCFALTPTDHIGEPNTFMEKKLEWDTFSSTDIIVVTPDAERVDYSDIVTAAGYANAEDYSAIPDAGVVYDDFSLTNGSWLNIFQGMKNAITEYQDGLIYMGNLMYNILPPDIANMFSIIAFLGVMWFVIKLVRG